MAAMVARGSSQLPSSVSVQEKGSRNKRKFHSDLPVGDSNKLAPLQSECSSYELDKSDNTLAPAQQGALDLCGFHQDQNDGWSKLEHGSSLDFGGDWPKDELEAEESRDVDWSDIIETQLEELVLNTLDTIYKSAIKRIAASGYSEDLAVKAVLRPGLYYGCKDTVSNIVDNALTSLRNRQEIDSPQDLIFMDLQQLECYILAEMVCVLRLVRPFFSTGDAMWCLLICDMNMNHACAMDDNVFGNNFGSSDVAGSSSVSNVSDIKSDANSSVQSGPEVSIPRPSRPNKLIPNLPAPRFSSSGNAFNLEKEISVSSAGRVEESSSLGEECLLTVSQSSAYRSSGMEDKLGSGRKVHMNSSKRESILRQKSIHLEKTYRAYGSRAALKSGKLSGLTSFFMDKKCKPVAEAAISTSNLKNASLKISKAVGVGASVTDGIANAVSNAGPADLEYSTKTIGNPSALSVANTELSLSLPLEANVASKPSTNVETTISDAGVSSDKIIGQLVPDDKKDEMLVKLVHRLQELQTQVQKWTEWGQHRVMQAARRLSKDKAELTTLRQEKEEVARLRKEKQTLEENTMKKLSEMENALLKASGQVDMANATVRRLEVENSQLRREMEAAKLQAAESAASCQEVSRREKKTLKKYESWERQKSLFREELVTEKRKLSQLQQQLEQAKEYHSQLEVRWKQEGKMKEEALMQANSERKEREEIEAAAKLKEDTIRSKAETDLQRYRDDIQRFESEISKLRLKTDSSKIAALRWSIDGSYASRPVDARSNLSLKETNVHDISDMVDILDLGIGRERECVMCLTEEMSVVFLPCAHQVVCTNCNEIHEKQGMKDCPSCRTPIQQRIHVRSADS